MITILLLILAIYFVGRILITIEGWIQAEGNRHVLEKQERQQEKIEALGLPTFLSSQTIMRNKL